MIYGTDLLIAAELEALQEDVVPSKRGAGLNDLDLLKDRAADLDLDGNGLSGRLSAMLTVAGLAGVFHKFLHFINQSLLPEHTGAERVGRQYR